MRKISNEKWHRSIFLPVTKRKSIEKWINDLGSRNFPSKSLKSEIKWKTLRILTSISIRDSMLTQPAQLWTRQKILKLSYDVPSCLDEIKIAAAPSLCHSLCSIEILVKASLRISTATKNTCLGRVKSEQTE